MPRTPRTVTVSELNADGRVELAVGDILEFDLYENPATGFRWQLEVEQASLFRALENDFQIYSSAVGGGGRVHLRLLSLTAGTTRVEAVSARSWQREAVGGTRFALTVAVKAESP